ncbi:hypothetical protein Pelo_16327 [Pelomyxa schiedti]|nr:hypothetical protein Pelo_16327 [Pelomyxa schiedti]
MCDDGCAKHFSDDGEPPPYPPTIVPLPRGMSSTAYACYLRDQFQALLMYTHPRCGGSETFTVRPSLASCTRTSSARWSALRVLWRWIVDFPSLFFCLEFAALRSFTMRSTMVTFGVSPLTGSITHDVRFWDDTRPTSTLVSVNTYSTLSLFTSPKFWGGDAYHIATGNRLGLWEDTTPFTQMVATGKWYVACLGRDTHLSVTPTYGNDAGGRCLIDVPQAMPQAYCSSTHGSLFFNHAVPDEAALMLVGDGSESRNLPCLANLRVIDLSRTWETKKFSEVSSTSSKFGASACKIGSGVVLRKLSGARVFVTVLDRDQAGKSVVVIEEGTGIQIGVGAGNEDGGPSIVDTLCQVNSTLFCIAKHKAPTAPLDPGFELFTLYAPTWYEVWDCNSLDFSSPLRTVQCPVGCASMFAEGGFICTATRDSASRGFCLLVTDQSSGIVVFSFKYPADLRAHSVFSLLV